MNPEHHFALSLDWTGNRGTGTSGYRDYSRAHEITAEGKPGIAGSSARVFHGDSGRWNPEEMLIAALSQCHLLSYLHVATNHGVVVTAYTDAATGSMVQDDAGGGRFTLVTLHPLVTISAPTSEADVAELMQLATDLHEEAATRCFIAASVNFPVLHEPRTVVAER
ncbi:MAG: OsmC family protein [Burkholderiaceae bacterium]|nr:OsmC family protein [Microbacteriaceae bacterium]